MYPPESISISSVLVNARPDLLHEAQVGLAALPGVEVHAVTEDGRLIVTIEADSAQSVAEMFTVIGRQPGVLSASMVYHQYESNPDQEV